MLSTFSNVSSETTGPIEAKFHMESPWDGGTKVCSNGSGNMTKMAAMLKYYLVFSNDNPGLTLTYLTTRSNLVPYAFVWEKGKTMGLSEIIVVYVLKPATDDRSDKRFLLTSKLCPLRAVCPLHRGYIHVLNHEKKV